jgi:hypothetical protein
MDKAGKERDNERREKREKDNEERERETEV